MPCKCIYKGVKSREGCGKITDFSGLMNGLKKDYGCCFWHILGWIKENGFDVHVGKIFTCLGGD